MLIESYIAFFKEREKLKTDLWLTRQTWSNLNFFTITLLVVTQTAFRLLGITLIQWEHNRNLKCPQGQQWLDKFDFSFQSLCEISN